MKQFSTIFNFEFKNVARNKIFLGITIVIVIVLSLVLTYPRISQAIKGDKSKETTKGKTGTTSAAVLVQNDLDEPSYLSAFQHAFSDGYKLTAYKGSVEDLKKDINNKKYEFAFVIDKETHYSYITATKGMYDYNTQVATACMQSMYRVNKSIEQGMNPSTAIDINSVVVKNDMVVTGKDQTKTFFYAYVVVFMLYMLLIIYGQYVASSVATEKGSRTMEVLITSAKPTNLMFGKVLGTGSVGILQFIIMLLTGALGYYFNRAYWKNNMVIQSFFDVPANVIIFSIVFFILGYFIYAFMYGALGSLASKIEDINSLIMPVTFILIFAFIAVVAPLAKGVDTTLMKVLSFIPFTSPFAMIARISMTVVPMSQIIISLAILIASVIGIGYFAAMVYKAGVLMYGNKPSISTVFKAIKQQK